MSISQLSSQVASLVDGFSGTAGIIIKEVSTGASLRINENEQFVAASIIKLSILWELYRQIEAGSVKATDRIMLSEKHKVGGTGILHELEPAIQPTINDLAMLMIILSDNVATNLLIDMLGFQNINQTIKALGLEATILQRKMMDTDRAQQGFENYTTAGETAILLERYLGSEKLSAVSRATMIDILKRQQYNDRLSADLPEDVVFAHKTGQLAGIEHDAGILFLENHQLIMVVLTRAAEGLKAGIQLCSTIGELVYHHYAG